MAEDRKSRDPLYITIIIILLLSTGGFGYSWYVSKNDLAKCNGELDSLLAERDELTKMLEGNGMIDLASNTLKDNLQSLLSEYNNVSNANDTMSAKISEQKEHIRQLLEEAEKHKHDAYHIVKLQKEAETLRRIMRGYVHQIDSLYAMNKELQADIVRKDGQIKTISEERDNVLDKNKNLEETVAKGSLLQTSGITATAIRLRNNGKQVETSRAGKADMIKTCMTIMENRIARAGTKNVYMVVINPDGTILTADPNSSVETQDGALPFSLRREVDYQNANLDLCMYAEVKEDLKPGTYIVKIYCDKAQIGKSTFTLK